jgi:hypothetical protein
MTPTDEEIAQLQEEVRIKVALADKIAASRPGQPQPSLPLSSHAAKTALALAGLPDDAAPPMVRGTYRTGGPGPQTKR